MADFYHRNKVFSDKFRLIIKIYYDGSMRHRVVGMRRHEGWTLDRREGRSLNKESRRHFRCHSTASPHFTPLPLPTSHHCISPLHEMFKMSHHYLSPLHTTVFPHFMRCFLLSLSSFHVASILNVLHTFKKLSYFLRIGFWSWKGCPETWQRCQLLSKGIKRRHTKLRSDF